MPRRKPSLYTPPAERGPRAPGSIIAEFEVPARPCPWKAPHTTRSGRAFKDANLIAWQDTVALMARVAMAGRLPYAGRVKLQMMFSLVWSSMSQPDLSNLNKGTEDALQGIVILNDAQVEHIDSSRIFGDADGAWIRVLAV